MGSIFKKLDRQQSVASNTHALDANVLSPNASAFLASVLFPNVDESLYPVTVQEAMAVPAVARGIGLYSGICSRFPITSNTNLEWPNKTRGAVTPQLRIAQTIQDLIFYNACVWAVERDDAGYVTDAIRVSPERWSVDKDGFIIIDGVDANQDELIYIASLLPIPFLEAARASVRHYTSISSTINNRVAVPEPVTLVEETQEFSGDVTEIDEMLDNLRDTLINKRGGLVHQPYGLKVSGFGAGADSANQMMIEARMAVRTDLANHLNINSAMLDGSTGSNEIYSNSLQQGIELLEYSLKLFTQPIIDRLSQDDVTPEGVKLAFDYSALDKLPDGKGNVGTTTEITND